MPFPPPMSNQQFEKDVVAGDPNDRLRSKTYSFSVAGNKGGNADNFTNRLREAGRSEQATEMLLTETTAHSTRIRAQLEVIRLIEHCATREEAERVLVERMNELTHRGNALRTEIDRVKAAVRFCSVISYLITHTTRYVSSL